MDRIIELQTYGKSRFTQKHYDRTLELDLAPFDIGIGVGSQDYLSASPSFDVHKGQDTFYVPSGHWVCLNIDGNMAIQTAGFPLGVAVEVDHINLEFVEGTSYWNLEFVEGTSYWSLRIANLTHRPVLIDPTLLTVDPVEHYINGLRDFYEYRSKLIERSS